MGIALCFPLPNFQVTLRGDGSRKLARNGGGRSDLCDHTLPALVRKTVSDTDRESFRRVQKPKFAAIVSFLVAVLGDVLVDVRSEVSHSESVPLKEQIPMLQESGSG